MATLLATLEVVGETDHSIIPPGGTFVLSGELPDSADLGEISFVVFGIDLYARVTGSGVVSETQVQWAVGVDEDFEAIVFPSGPPVSTVRTGAKGIQPNGQPWTWAAVNALIVRAQATFVLGLGELGTLSATRFFAEVFSLEGAHFIDIASTLGAPGAEGEVGELEVASLIGAPASEASVGRVEMEAKLGATGEGALPAPAVAGGRLGVNAEGVLSGI